MIEEPDDERKPLEPKRVPRTLLLWLVLVAMFVAAYQFFAR